MAENKKAVNTSFDYKARTWRNSMPENLSRHDVVYLSPPEDALSGIPIGNGDMGLLLWTDGSRLIAALNKVDLFDDCIEPENVSDGVEYDREPSLKHGARMIMDFGMPVFDILYLTGFEGRLSLADATAYIETQTPFAAVKIWTYAVNPDNVIVLKCQADFKEDNCVETVFERFGSRPYSYWYSKISREAGIGLDGTKTEANNNTILIRQDLRTLHFVIGARISGLNSSVERLSSNSGKLTSEKSTKVNFTIYITAVTSENDNTPYEKVKRILDDAELKGVNALYNAHTEDWNSFWKASFVHLPEDYLENIWYLNLYYANSSSRGDYPMRFNNGIWNWNRDIANWVYYFHWNMQNFIWPLHAANHAELARPYFNYRTRSLPNAKKYAEKYQKHKGAFYADVADRLGHNVGRRWNNNTPGAQIALLYWKHYKYTLDTEFLIKEAWPVMLEVTRYYADFLVKGMDGKYRSIGSQAYEGSPLFEETITDTANIGALLSAVIQCAHIVEYTGKEITKWKDISENLIGFHTQPMEEDEYCLDETGAQILKHGLGKGKPAVSGQVFTVGKYLMLDGEENENFNWDAIPDFIKNPLKGIKRGDRVRKSYGNPERAEYYGIPDVEFAPVYPAEIIGMKDKGSMQYNVSVDQVRLHPPAKPPEHLEPGSMAGESALCMGWCSYPIVLARLGLAEEAAEAAMHSISAWQFYCQGFGHYGPYEIFMRDRDKRWNTNTVRVDKTDDHVESPAWPFRHFTFEAVPIVCTALNEMLLQSHEGFIRVFPAAPRGWKKEFMLAAQGGFIVHAQGDGERTHWVAVESKCGKSCKIANPFETGIVYISVINNKGKIIDSLSAAPQLYGNDKLLEFPTNAGMLYLLAPENNITERWNICDYAPVPNKDVKRLGKAVLGMPRMY